MHYFNFSVRIVSGRNRGKDKLPIEMQDNEKSGSDKSNSSVGVETTIRKRSELITH